MGEASDKRSAFDGYRWLALFGMGDQCGEIFGLSVFTFRNIVCSFQTTCTCNVDTVFVGGVRTWRNDTVACE